MLLSGFGLNFVVDQGRIRIQCPHTLTASDPTKSLFFFAPPLVRVISVENPAYSVAFAVAMAVAFGVA
jgi:hypothetical protein